MSTNVVVYCMFHLVHNTLQLKKAYEELNKRIYEHDKCTHQGGAKAEVTLKVRQPYSMYVHTVRIYLSMLSLCTQMNIISVQMRMPVHIHIICLKSFFSSIVYIW